MHDSDAEHETNLIYWPDSDHYSCVQDLYDPACLYIDKVSVPKFAPA